MKKLRMLLVLFIIVSLSMVGCNNSSDEKEKTTTNISTESSSSKANDDAKVNIGILQLIEHGALDDACRGFKVALQDNGYIEGKNLTIDFQNAQGDQSNLKAISQRFVRNKSDLILAIATPAAQSVAAETSTIPILVTAVTDPENAKLVESNEKPNTNVTGTTDMNPIKEQIELIQELVPDVKTIGLLYASGEDNSILQIEVAKEQITKLGLEYVEKTVSSQNEVQQVTQSLVGKVDAIYIPTDNIIAASMPIVGEITGKNKIPVICGESSMVMAGGLATLGIDYYRLGYQTGEMAVRILKDGANPKDMPIESLKHMDYTISREMVNMLGITIPEDLQQYIK